MALKQQDTSSHTSVAAALNNLAVLHCLMVTTPTHTLQHTSGAPFYTQGNYADAVPLYDKALKVYKDTYGSDHPIVTETIRNRRLAVDSI